MIPEFSVDTVTVEQQVTKNKKYKNFLYFTLSNLLVTFFQEALKLLEASELV